MLNKDHILFSRKPNVSHSLKSFILIPHTCQIFTIIWASFGILTVLLLIALVFCMQCETNSKDELLWKMLCLRLIPNHQDAICIAYSCFVSALSPRVGGSINFLKAGSMLYILSCVAQCIDEWRRENILLALPGTVFTFSIFLFDLEMWWSPDVFENHFQR